MSYTSTPPTYTGFPRFGAADSASPANIAAARANFQKIFSGEVYATAQAATVFLDKHQVRDIDHGKSASFSFLGQVTAKYHGPGVAINPNDIRTAEREIFVDAKLIAPTFINDIDEVMNHFEVRSRYSRRLGEALAQTMDKRIALLIVKAARVSSPIVSGDADVSSKLVGSAITDALMATDAASLVEKGILAAGQKLDEKDVMTGRRYAALAPAQYWMLVADRTYMNKDWGGSGGLASGSLPEIGNIALVKTNNMPNTNITTDPSVPADPPGTENQAEAIAYTSGQYTGDFSKTVAAVFTEDAVATVRLQGVQVESDYEVRTQGTLVVAKTIVGHGILNPQCAVELATP